MGALPPVEQGLVIRVNGRRVYTLAEASDLLHVGHTTLRKRIQYGRIQPAGWINGRLAVYYPTDLGLPE